ncbi:MAG TPA: MoaD/ThiS family protein [Methanocella sp.]|uniref:MoaD/ThiS family protein n=1 Tax=Methanocella sp. TaxID=2052833 RepID=UPI002CCFF7F6|nr:MoaD/ThiS family protein [Methanocella sp.]HTY91926.1 MoaD/ThiS family protein [Methanocella sp.]
MPVCVDIIGHARSLFGCSRYAFEAKPGFTLKGLMEELSKLARPDFRKSIYDVATGKMNEHIAVFVNAREARSLKGLDTELRDGDVVTILPPMAGG